MFCIYQIVCKLSKHGRIDFGNNCNLMCWAKLQLDIFSYILQFKLRKRKRTGKQLLLYANIYHTCVLSHILISAEMIKCKRCVFCRDGHFRPWSYADWSENEKYRNFSTFWPISERPGRKCPSLVFCKYFPVLHHYRYLFICNKTLPIKRNQFQHSFRFSILCVCVCATK